MTTRGEIARVTDFTVVDGHLDVPDRPGLGVTVDEAFVEKYRVTD